MKIIFAGTPEFAVPCLQACIDAPHEVIACYTQPDRPAGRGRKLTPSPVKQRALEHQIPVYQPVSLKGEAEQAELAALEADLMVVVAYGLLLPQAVLDAPRLGCVNVHASLLPRWRGAAPIQRAIEAGDSETGVTLMQMELGLDTGPMLAKVHCPIHADDTGSRLHDRLSTLGAELLAEQLDGLAQGTLSAQVQDDDLATYARKLDKQEARIDWRQPAAAIARQVRAFNAWPVAQCSYGGKPLRIWQAEALPGSGGTPGAVVRCDRQGVEVATGEGHLRILELQPPGKRPMPVEAYLNAHDLSGAQFE